MNWEISTKNGKGHTVYYCFPCRLHYYCVSVLFMYISSFSSYTFVVQLMLATGTAGAYLSLTTLVSCPVQPPPYAVFVPIPVLAFGELIYLYLIESKGIQISLACYWTRFLVLYSSVAYFSILLLFAKICLGKITLGGKHCWQLLKKKLNHADDESFLSLEGSLIFFGIIATLAILFKNSMFPCMAILIKTCSVSIPMIMMHI